MKEVMRIYILDKKRNKYFFIFYFMFTIKRDRIKELIFKELFYWIIKERNNYA